MFELHHAPASTTSQRVERKYPLPETMLPATMKELRELLPVHHHSGTHDWTSMRTTYLDTLDWGCYQEYLNNLPVRRKIRIRQYGIDGQFDNVCWVEVKVKNHNISLKRRFRCLTDDLAMLIHGEDVADTVAGRNETDVSQTYEVIRSMILDQQLVPVVRVEYERLSFQPPESNGLRVTLDRDVRFISACQQYRGNLDGLVLETKHHGNKPTWLRDLRERLGLRRVKRFSKFARSMKQIGILRGEEPAE